MTNKLLVIAGVVFLTMVIGLGTKVKVNADENQAQTSISSFGQYVNIYSSKINDFYVVIDICNEKNGCIEIVRISK
jgi:hypothetical protein